MTSTPRTVRVALTSLENAAIKNWTVEPNLPDLHCALDVALSCSGEKLTRSTAERTGYTNSDIGVGVVYATEVDDYDLANGGAIPEGYVRVFAPPLGLAESEQEYLIAETEWFEIVKQLLALSVRHRNIDS